ncbi:MAG: hypothetical protein ACI4RV_01780 [Eubacteriales bacterium]
MIKKTYRTPKIEIALLRAADFLMNSGEVDISTDPLFGLTESIWQD